MLVCLLMTTAFATIASAEEELTEDEAVFLGLGIALCLVVIIIPLILAVIACIWIYKDAEKRGKSGILWVILLLACSLFLSFIGFIIIIVVWLIVRPPIGGEPSQQQQQGQGRVCPNCGRPIPMDAQVCPYCGNKFGP